MGLWFIFLVIQQPQVVGMDVGLKIFWSVRGATSETSVGVMGLRYVFSFTFGER